MAQTVKFTFVSTTRVGKMTYSAGYVASIPADQVFGPIGRRNLAPFDIFTSGMLYELYHNNFVIQADIMMELDGVVMKKGDQFSANPSTTMTVEQVDFVIEPGGDFTVKISGVPNAKPVAGPTEVDDVTDIPDGATGFYLVKTDADKGGPTLYVYFRGQRLWVASVEDTEV